MPAFAALKYFDIRSTLLLTDSSAFSVAASGEDDHMRSDFGIYVQPVPRPEADISAATGDSRGVPPETEFTSFDSFAGNVVVAATPPMRIASGRNASWSPC